MLSTQSTRPRERRKLHPDVLRLGLVSFLNDLSSEIIFSTFAVFFTSVAGASSALLGLVEGLADFSASSLNYMAGRLSDRSGNRKLYASAGYGFSTAAKMILLVTNSVVGLGMFRVIERLGKGFRGPPRDAWLASIAPAGTRGFAFGVHKALDKSGAVVGPLFAYGLLSWLGETPNSYRILFWIAIVPAILAVTLLARIGDRPGVRREPESVARNWSALSPAFKNFLWPSGAFALGYFSVGFLLLKARDSGYSAAGVVLLYALFNITAAAAAPLVGRLGDAVGRRPVILLGYGVYGAVNLAFVFAGSRWEIAALFAAYGVFYAIDESQSRAFIADIEPARCASAIGVYNSATGVLYLPASLASGALWMVAPALAFSVAAMAALAAAACLIVLRPAP